MSTVAVPHATAPSPVARRILLAGAVVALLDITYAYIFFGLILKLVGVHSLFQSISSGLLGRAAYQGGLPTALLGAGFHLLIAYSWTVAFYLAVPQLRRAAPSRAHHGRADRAGPGVRRGGVPADGPGGAQAEPRPLHPALRLEVLRQPGAAHGDDRSPHRPDHRRRRQAVMQLPNDVGCSTRAVLPPRF